MLSNVYKIASAERGKDKRHITPDTCPARTVRLCTTAATEHGLKDPKHTSEKHFGVIRE